MSEEIEMFNDLQERISSLLADNKELRWRVDELDRMIEIFHARYVHLRKLITEWTDDAKSLKNNAKKHNALGRKLTKLFEGTQGYTSEKLNKEITKAKTKGYANAKLIASLKERVEKLEPADRSKDSSK